MAADEVRRKMRNPLRSQVKVQKIPATTGAEEEKEETKDMLANYTFDLSLVGDGEEFVDES